MINRFSVNDFPNDIEYIEEYDLKTGDILCVSYNNIAGAFVGSFTHSAWIHTGLIWVDPKTNIRYVMEGAIYKKKEYKHFFKIPFITWYNINKRNVCGINKYSGPEIDAVEMDRQFARFSQSKLEGLNLSWGKYLRDEPYSGDNQNKKYTCFESTIVMLQRMNIYKKDRVHFSYFPSNVVNNEIPLEDGIKYSKTIQIKPNPYTMKLLDDELRRNDKKIKK